MVKILPYFDWRYLKNKRCLIEKFNTSPNSDKIFFNCDLCENINKIDVYEKIDQEILRQRYIELDIPLIVSKALDKWPKNSSFIENLILDDDFYFSYPCKLSTNILKGSRKAGNILEKVKLFDEFFLHFQNCAPDAMRIFRKFTYRPDFLPPTYSPILYNWLVWNKNYNTTNYKLVNLVEKLAVFGQLFGTTYIQLIPRQNCAEICPILDIKLNAGEVLIFTSMWDLEYRPKEDSENMAVILETRV
ncbi:hypothetical protein NQ314_006314 [Rhamnusium bicolor]|uniref:Uncharacterized protein n=1 Tax=Rhamnusium bicolor TaxID=1586634 RepID=A0AAV8Z4Q4_9CUCU|nr:hypothetical protein NQ314_006314 [Rhamnusium bicolor]